MYTLLTYEWHGLCIVNDIRIQPNLGEAIR